jgi:hypothetical protein
MWFPHSLTKAWSLPEVRAVNSLDNLHLAIERVFNLELLSHSITRQSFCQRRVLVQYLSDGSPPFEGHSLGGNPRGM